VTRRGTASVVTRAFATSPLRLLTPANHGHAAWIYTSSFGGGLVDGDDLALDLTIGAGASAYLSTQSATKVYRSPGGTRARTRGVVERNGLLIAAPDPVVPFAGSRYRQRQQFDIAADAGLVVVDVVASGRRAAGERWSFLEYESVVAITIGGRLRVYDAIALRQADGDVNARLGRFNVLGLIVLAGGRLQHEVAAVAQEAAGGPVRPRADLVAAASVPASDLCIVRMAATAAEPMARLVQRLLRFVPAVLGDDPWSRKW
jgi:urease accessory protein